ncbi:hypothetical protein FEM48_Zijuj08G0067700 [Ziziphus jujuba var. spinosa]|nr:hypothetical protein FEM48_Zijuj08G0067700 [Ziziphus jujuba var. spinosa]
MMMIEAMEFKSLVLRRALEGSRSTKSSNFPPVRGGIKRKILALLFKKLKLASQQVVHYLLITKCSYHSDQIRIINIVLPQQIDNGGNSSVPLEEREYIGDAQGRK